MSQVNFHDSVLQVFTLTSVIGELLRKLNTDKPTFRLAYQRFLGVPFPGDGGVDRSPFTLFVGAKVDS